MRWVCLRELAVGPTELLEQHVAKARVGLVDAVEKLGGVPVTAVGVGPGREQTPLMGGE